MFAAENRNYFLLLGTTLFLVAFGLVMVLSSSSIESNGDGEGFFGRFMRQGLYAIVGHPADARRRSDAHPVLEAVGVARASSRRRPAAPRLHPRSASAYGGNHNWISIGGFNAQPSEFVKLALIVWVAWVLSTKQDLLDDWKHVLLPIGPVAGIAILFVLIGNDLGTASSWS